MYSPGLKIILMGAPGSGKTHSIRTLIDADLEVFCILTEPNAYNTLTNTEGASEKYKAAVAGNGKLHWHYIKPAGSTWESMHKQAKMLSDFDLGALQKIAASDKKQHTQFLEVLQVCANFEDQLTGKELGPIDDLDPYKHCVVIDSLSGLNQMFLSLVCGTKPVKTLPEWGAAIDTELHFVNHLCFGISVHVVLMAHLAREVDEVQGGVKVMVNALGRKAPQEMPKNFTDCILAKREANEFVWSGADANTETKTTTLTPGKKYPPTFVPLIGTWRTRTQNVGEVNV